MWLTADNVLFIVGDSLTAVLDACLSVKGKKVPPTGVFTTECIVKVPGVREVNLLVTHEDNMHSSLLHDLGWSKTLISPQFRSPTHTIHANVAPRTRSRRDPKDHTEFAKLSFGLSIDITAKVS